MAKQKTQSLSESQVPDDVDSGIETIGAAEEDEGTTDAEVEVAVDMDEAFDDESSIDLELGDVQCSGRDASIRRAIEERREARRLKDDLDYLEMDD